jgi:hypothetical protein
MSPRVLKQLSCARDDLENARREPPGPECLSMKQWYRERASQSVRFARLMHRRDLGLGFRGIGRVP